MLFLICNNVLTLLLLLSSNEYQRLLNQQPLWSFRNWNQDVCQENCHNGGDPSVHKYSLFLQTCSLLWLNMGTRSLLSGIQHLQP